MLLTAAWLAPTLIGCNRGDDANHGSAAPARERRNVVLIVWDTVRSDRLGLYGYEKPTTPFLEEFSQKARVFEDCVSVSNTTAPTHVAMFTGLTPFEHGVNNEAPRVPGDFELLAETLRAAGYQTYMFSENPYVCTRNGFAAGFDLAEYPWSRELRQRAIMEVRRKFTGRSDIRAPRRPAAVAIRSLASAGEIIPGQVERWLDQRDATRPFFMFLNFMEAHGPLIPPREFREKTLTPNQLARSYAPEVKDPLPIWSYVFRLRPDRPGEIDLLDGLYSAAILELDELFRQVVSALDSRGLLDDTAIILVSDHGEHLGERHLIDHQFSVYEPLMRVPLVVYCADRVTPGRDGRPVQNIDVYPTVLEFAGLAPPSATTAASLLTPRETRGRVGECPAYMAEALRNAQRIYPDFDPAPWRRTLRAYYEEPYKLIAASDGGEELYDLGADPGELNNLIDKQPQAASRLRSGMDRFFEKLRPRRTATSAPSSAPDDPEYRRRLEAIGYITPDDENDTP